MSDKLAAVYTCIEQINHALIKTTEEHSWRLSISIKAEFSIEMRSLRDRWQQVVDLFLEGLPDPGLVAEVASYLIKSVIKTKSQYNVSSELIEHAMRDITKAIIQSIMDENDLDNPTHTDMKQKSRKLLLQSMVTSRPERLDNENECQTASEIGTNSLSQNFTTNQIEDNQSQLPQPSGIPATQSQSDTQEMELDANNLVVYVDGSPFISILNTLFDAMERHALVVSDVGERGVVETFFSQLWHIVNIQYIVQIVSSCFDKITTKSNESGLYLKPEIMEGYQQRMKSILDLVRNCHHMADYRDDLRDLLCKLMVMQPPKLRI